MGETLDLEFCTIMQLLRLWPLRDRLTVLSIEVYVKVLGFREGKLQSKCKHFLEILMLGGAAC